MLGLPTMRVERVGSLEAPDPAMVMVSSSVTATGDVVALWSAPDDIFATWFKRAEPGGEVWDESRSPNPVAVAVARTG
jgi:hypothetical protein